MITGLITSSLDEYILRRGENPCPDGTAAAIQCLQYFPSRSDVNTSFRHSYMWKFLMQKKMTTELLDVALTSSKECHRRVKIQLSSGFGHRN